MGGEWLAGQTWVGVLHTPSHSTPATLAIMIHPLLTTLIFGNQRVIKPEQMIEIQIGSTF